MGLLIGAPATEVAVARLMLTAGCGVRVRSAQAMDDHSRCCNQQ